MKSEIPTSTTTAPIPIATALLPLSPLAPPVEVVAVLVSVGVVALGTAAGDWGTPGANGLPPVPAPGPEEGAVTAPAAEPISGVANIVAAMISAATTTVHASRLRNGANAPKRAAAPSPWCQAV